MTTTEQSAAEFDWAHVLDYARRTPIEPPRTQYELPGVTQEDHLGVPVVVVPLWHAVVTARITLPPEAAALADARRRLDAALSGLESIYPLCPSGLFIQVAYGLSYFRRLLPQTLCDHYLPRSTRSGSEGQKAVIDAVRFPKDPEDLVLESHDVAFHFKSDYRHHIDEAIDALFRRPDAELNGMPAGQIYLGDLFQLTTVRRGFAGRSLPRSIGMRLGIPGADRIPPGSMLFMGFTSSHLHGLAAGNLASFETVPGWTDQTPVSYFAGGAAMHLSHIAIELDQWYTFPHAGRLHRMFHPRRSEPEEVLSPDQSPETATYQTQRDDDAATFGLVGHNEQMQFLSRVEEATTTAYGEQLERGTVFFLRQDFDTTENPFAFSAEGSVSSTPRAGVHFVGLGPSAQHFELMRTEMDNAELRAHQPLAEENLGFTKFLVTTHRQNFLLPPRAHRSFPLVELL